MPIKYTYDEAKTYYRQSISIWTCILLELLLILNAFNVWIYVNNADILSYSKQKNLYLMELKLEWVQFVKQDNEITIDCNENILNEH